MFALVLILIMIMILRINNHPQNLYSQSPLTLNILDDNFTGQESSETNNGNIELVKLQGFLATITEEWKGNKGQYI